MALEELCQSDQITPDDLVPRSSRDEIVALPTRLPMGSYRDLLAYRLAVELADDLRATVIAWPSIDRWTLGVQMIRAADSIGANIAEAVGRGTLVDQRRMVPIARGSAYELQHWIERAFSRSLLNDDAHRARAARVGQLVNGLLRSYRRRA